MGNTQAVHLSHEENQRMRELSVYTALLISLTHNKTRRPDARQVSALTPSQLAPLALNADRSHRPSPADSAEAKTPDLVRTPSKLPPIKAGSSYDA